MADSRGTRRMTRQLTAIIEREGERYVFAVPGAGYRECGGHRAGGASGPCKEALELFFETASPGEIESRLSGEVYVTQVQVAVP